MSRRSVLAAAVLALVPAFTATSAQADSLGVANSYNVFVLHDMTQWGTDAEGRIAVGGDANLSSYSVASKLPSNSTATNLVVGGTVTQTGGTVNGTALSSGNYTLSYASITGNLYAGGSINQNGGSTQAVVAGGNYTTLYSPPTAAIVAGNYTQTGGNGPSGGATVGGKLTLAGGAGGSGHFQVNGNVDANGAGYVGGGITYAGIYAGPTWEPNLVHGSAVAINTAPYTALPFSFADAANYLTDQSAYWAALSTNGTAVRTSGNLNLTGTSSSLNVFDLNSSMLAGGGFSFNINVPTGSTVLINIDGNNFTLGNFGYVLTGVDAEHILYNAYDATAFTLSNVGLKGSLLAPLASVNFATGNIDGTLIANNLYGQGESHLHLFAGDLLGPPAAGPSLTPSSVPTPAAAASGCVLLGLLAFRKLRRSAR